LSRSSIVTEIVMLLQLIDSPTEYTGFPKSWESSTDLSSFIDSLTECTDPWKSWKSSACPSSLSSSNQSVREVVLSCDDSVSNEEFSHNTSQPAPDLTLETKSGSMASPVTRGVCRRESCVSWPALAKMKGAMISSPSVDKFLCSTTPSWQSRCDDGQRALCGIAIVLGMESFIVEFCKSFSCVFQCL